MCCRPPTFQTNVALLNAAQTFSGVNGLTNAGNTLVGTHSGSGFGLTNLNITNLTGTLQAAQFPTALPAASGANLTGINLPANSIVTNLTATDSTTNNIGLIVSTPAGLAANAFQVLNNGTNWLTIDNRGFFLLPSYGDLCQGIVGSAYDQYWNPAHPGGGEEQMTSQGSISLNIGYNNLGSSTLQIGSSGPFHEYINIQYDDGPDATHLLGYSKCFSFCSRYYTNGNVAEGYNNQNGAFPQLRGEGVATNGAARLAFYNPGNMQVGGGGNTKEPSGGVLQGAMLTNGWLLNGLEINSLATSSPNSTNVLIDFNGVARKNVINLSQAAFFIVTNIGTLTNQYEDLQFDIFPGASAFALSFPANWIWLNDAGTAVAPTNIPANTVLRVTVGAEVGSVTNIVARYSLGSYASVVDTNAVNFFNAVINAGGSLNSVRKSNARLTRWFSA